MEQFIQIKIENSEDFKNEIIRGVVSQIKDLGIFNQPKEENSNELISRAETAKILNISLVKLWEITKNNLLPVYKIGGKVLYKRNEIKDFINSQNKS
ncbi:MULTISPECIES: helix-turn-helix domain-containing protein [unclassified Flavobacterium]|jgi:excisionase family DNA binding protein|uniref:helix-turn-helix domain-containing protein n=1 Tax=unclassified Flavobacterium TaxID=196869 RepID=UPI00129132FF|nr:MULTISPECIES: helix-turn-helix domain-containing protein [unclassified Flavobacterium]MQP52699.1 helix-turn-helix domain-containing protein [Flavobacterium sp. LMO9]MQP62121.1 helix-turn-helix domain-containing protein [Flavobacterium sp. LMO6]